jgi:predicted metal-dependent enzyme (double-stranded beta helix superfamily)/uncharacterized protein YndB with AHSA1/START domain
MLQTPTAGTVAFERSHDIVVNAPAAAVFDYVTNPQSWPEWIDVSHRVDSADRPLERGETFSEQWFSRHAVQLDWTVLESDWPRRWVAETHADFLGPIVVRYDFEPAPGGSRFTRTVGNPARPKPPRAETLARIDAEAAAALGNIKGRVERMYAARAAARCDAISDAIADIRALVGDAPVDRPVLARVRDRLVSLASRADLFPRGDLPPPFPDADARSILYRLAEDDDHRFALYANASRGGYGTPAHNHTTWAVIAGVHGRELNRFYDRSDDGGVRERAEFDVVAGRGVAFMPDDLHSIHIEAPLLHLHLYGLGLEQLHRREFYDPATQRWDVFPAHADIRDARSGRA